MTFGMKVRTIKNGAPLALVLTLALVLVPVGASADQQVCNTASNSSHNGTLAVDTVNDPAYVHNNTGLSAKNNANLNAARHSRALALCGEPAPAADEFDGQFGGGTS